MVQHASVGLAHQLAEGSLLAALCCQHARGERQLRVGGVGGHVPVASPFQCHRAGPIFARRDEKSTSAGRTATGRGAAYFFILSLTSARNSASSRRMVSMLTSFFRL